jgi:beta-galactosidase
MKRIRNLQVSTLGESLSLNGRDSKIHVVEYGLGVINLIYSIGEVFGWKKSAGSRSTLVLYGGEGELHEFAVPADLGKPSVVQEIISTLLRRKVDTV